MGNKYGALFDEDADPAATLLLQILRQAKHDAKRGDLAALAWLVYAGIDLAEEISTGYGETVLTFCRQCWEDLAEPGQKRFKRRYGV